ncbi:MAG: valine--tRNA ligase [Pseudomonadota bacterium]
MKELEKAYQPKDVEKKWYKYWEENNLFAPNDNPKPYCIVIPPPNITGILHMGHALNNTIQDLIIRWKRMQGFATLWQPGVDHAGIATQNVVERALFDKEGKRRHEIGRDELIKRIWKWKDEYGNRIIDQLKKLGSSCDWSRLRFTLDDGLSHAVKENFVKLYKKGLIYKGKYIINWCPRCLTALADDEVEHEDKKGSLWYIRYPLVEREKEFVVVATTRPETLLGDTAVAVNPSDERYKHLIGKRVHLPETEREIPIIADDFVDAKFGTGAVKVTPAHDPNDFQIGLRHNLPQFNVMNDDATMNENAGKKYAGLSTKEARAKIVEELKTSELLEKIEDHQNAVGHCYRCHSIIEPRLSDQWFVKMRPLAEKAIKATEEGKVKFHPARWTDFYLQWLDNVRDWCISRQIWWGHRIPVWYCDKEGCAPIASKETPQICPHCGSKNLRQDEDVLDTWFSSALWPFSTLGWPDKTPELEKFYPTNLLVTDRGIIFFWVARMVMMGLENMNEVPFSDVYIHGTILDEEGRRMSKSLGNGIDPLEIIDQFGTDALRFSLMMLASEGQDLKLSVSKFEMGRNFCNKLWNASRFAMMNLNDYNGAKADSKHLSIADKWILNRLDLATANINASLDNYRFNEAASHAYHFVWNDFCDWYLEAIKPAMREEGAPKIKQAAQATLFHVLSSTLKLLHPFLPFITEEIWQHIGKDDVKSIMISAYPAAEKENPYSTEAQTFEKFIKEPVLAIRQIRGEHSVAPGKKISASIFASSTSEITNQKNYIMDMARLESLDISDKEKDVEKSAKAPLTFGTLFIPFAGLIDIEAEKSRLEKEIKKATDEKAALEKKLSNTNFVERAPKDIVDKEREKMTALTERLVKFEESLKNL